MRARSSTAPARSRHATLNGVDLDPATAERGRLPLPDLKADNVLVVSSRQTDTASGHGIQRTVDTSDKLVYLWTTFEPDMARRAFANFDQPDLKAVHAFTVSAPETWTVTSNSPHTSVDDLPDGGRVWRFADTPRLSTYVTVFNAGPFYEIRETRGGYDLGLYCRQSLKHLLDRDAEELFELTEQGLAWFGEKFGAPFPQEKYDQVFVPDMGGAMENWGCVTFGDGLLFRSTPTHSQRLTLTSILLHEMAHMWFGDLVTMKWWNDLWLNEAFASWAATWAAVGATKYRDGWATFLAGGKLEGYRVDMGPASHPIRGDVQDVSQAMANFDAISYHKGQSVLKQLSAYVGEEAFLTGLQAYFREHAWGNTRLEDLTGAVGAASGEDLSGWESAWLDSSGTDTLSLEGGTLLASGPHGDVPRPHRLDIGCYADDGDAGLRHVGDVAVRTDGRETPVALARLRPADRQRPRPDLRRGPHRQGQPRPDAAQGRVAPRRRLPGAGRRHGLRHARQGRALLRRRPDVRARRARDRDGAGRGRAVPAARQPDRRLLHARRPDGRAAQPGCRPGGRDRPHQRRAPAGRALRPGQQRDLPRALRPARRGRHRQHRAGLAGGGQPRGPGRVRPRGRRAAPGA